MRVCHKIDDVSFSACIAPCWRDCIRFPAPLERCCMVLIVEITWLEERAFLIIQVLWFNHRMSASPWWAAPIYVLDMFFKHCMPLAKLSNLSDTLDSRWLVALPSWWAVFSAFYSRSACRASCPGTLPSWGCLEHERRLWIFTLVAQGALTP